MKKGMTAKEKLKLSEYLLRSLESPSYNQVSLGYKTPLENELDIANLRRNIQCLKMEVRG